MKSYIKALAILTIPLVAFYAMNAGLSRAQAWTMEPMTEVWRLAAKKGIQEKTIDSALAKKELGIDLLAIDKESSERKVLWSYLLWSSLATYIISIALGARWLSRKLSTSCSMFARQKTPGWTSSLSLLRPCAKR